MKHAYSLTTPLSSPIVLLLHLRSLGETVIEQTREVRYLKSARELEHVSNSLKKIALS